MQKLKDQNQAGDGGARQKSWKTVNPTPPPTPHLTFPETQMAKRSTGGGSPEEPHAAPAPSPSPPVALHNSQGAWTCQKSGEEKRREAEQAAPPVAVFRQGDLRLYLRVDIPIFRQLSLRVDNPTYPASTHLTPPTPPLSPPLPPSRRE